MTPSLLKIISKVVPMYDSVLTARWMFLDSQEAQWLENSANKLNYSFKSKHTFS